MSHAATNWAIRQRGLKPAAKIVLWHLADCHNGHTGQCNPRQALLAEMCEMSRSTLNLHLAELERRGLIKRHRNVDKSTKKRRATHYTLAMDDDEIPGIPGSQNRTRPQDVETATQDVAEPCPDSGHGISEKPCPDSGKSHVRIPDIYIEPWNRTRNICVEPSEIGGCGMKGEHRESRLHLSMPRSCDENFDLEALTDRFMEAHPRPGNRSETAEALRDALGEGADPEQLIRAAEAYGREQDGNKPAFVAYSENWMRKGRWKAYRPKDRPSDDDIDTALAGLIRKHNPALCRSISPTKGRDLVAKGLVSEDDCREAGVL